MNIPVTEADIIAAAKKRFPEATDVQLRHAGEYYSVYVFGKRMTDDEWEQMRQEFNGQMPAIDESIYGASAKSVEKLLEQIEGCR